MDPSNIPPALHTAISHPPRLPSEIMDPSNIPPALHGPIDTSRTGAELVAIASALGVPGVQVGKKPPAKKILVERIRQRMDANPQLSTQPELQGLYVYRRESQTNGNSKEAIRKTSADKTVEDTAEKGKAEGGTRAYKTLVTALHTTDPPARHLTYHSSATFTRDQKAAGSGMPAIDHVSGESGTSASLLLAVPAKVGHSSKDQMVESNEIKARELGYSQAVPPAQQGQGGFGYAIPPRTPSPPLQHQQTQLKLPRTPRTPSNKLTGSQYISVTFVDFNTRTASRSVIVQSGPTLPIYTKSEAGEVGLFVKLSDLIPAALDMDTPLKMSDSRLSRLPFQADAPPIMIGSVKAIEDGNAKPLTLSKVDEYKLAVDGAGGYSCDVLLHWSNAELDRVPATQPQQMLANAHRAPSRINKTFPEGTLSINGALIKYLRELIDKDNTGWKKSERGPRLTLTTNLQQSSHARKPSFFNTKDTRIDHSEQLSERNHT
ncbi:hypothetical protein BC835DRAFT_1421830 [Cytidiella melzeri]|nr:hypothetical protein BC835DRAFT_1421830 [Cytidiella melzeri]